MTNNMDVMIIALDTETAAGREILEQWLNPPDVVKVQGRRFVGGMRPPDDSAASFIFAVDTVEALLGMLSYSVDLAAPFAERSVDGSRGVWLNFKLRGLPEPVRKSITAALDQFQRERLAARCPCGVCCMSDGNTCAGCAALSGPFTCIVSGVLVRLCSTCASRLTMGELKDDVIKGVAQSKEAA